MLLAVITIFFLLGYTGLIAFYGYHWKTLKEPRLTPESNVRVSVLVAARNEENTLPFLLNDLACQQYHTENWEVIIINDFSTDGTHLLAADLPPNFRMITPSCLPGESSKKKAIAAGVAAASGELILVTDADCRVGKQWVGTLAAYYRQTGASFIAAPVMYTGRPTLLHLLQIVDFITLQGITAASVSARFHAMCNGANLAYTRQAFEAVNGFSGIDQLPTGDDMLLMHKIWKKDPEKVFYLKNRKAIVTTAPMDTWKEFLMQRRRWASKTLLYDSFWIIAVLGYVLLFNLLPFVLLIAGIFHLTNFLYLLLFLGAKTLIEWPFVYAVSAFFKSKKQMRFFFLLQPFHLFYTVVVGIWSQFGGYQWKERNVEPTLSKIGRFRI